MSWRLSGGSLNPGEAFEWWFSWGRGSHVYPIQLIDAVPASPGGRIKSYDRWEETVAGGGYVIHLTVENIGSLPTAYYFAGAEVRA
jgi:hypothetical protein